MIENEGTDSSNVKSLCFFFAMVLLVTFSIAIGAYIMFNMDSRLARSVFYMLVMAIILDFFLLRNLIVLIITLSMKLVAKHKGSSRFLSFGSEMMADIHYMMRNVVENADESDESEIENFYQVNDPLAKAAE